MEPAVETVGAQLIRLFELAGVTAAFGIPGTHNLELYRGLSESGLRVVTTRHEQAAAYAADGFSRTTGRPALVIATSGPAVLNALVGVGTAYAESRPLILIAPGRPSRAPRDAGELHELGDVFAAAAAMTGWSVRLRTPDDVPLVVAEAVQRTHTGRPRPVFIEVPLDLLDQPATTATLPALVSAELPEPDDDALAEAADLVHTAQAVVVIAGGGAGTAVAELAEKTAAIVVTTTNGKGALAEDHPLSVGAAISAEAAMQAVNADSTTVIALGTELAESDLGPLRVDSDRLIRIDIDSGQLSRNARPRVALHGDADTTVRRLLARLEPASGSRRQAAERRAVAVRDAVRTEIGGGDNIAAAIVRALPRDAVVTADSSQIVYAGIVFEPFCARPEQFVYMSRAATLGYAVPAAIGAAIARPDLPVVAVAGDGAFLFSCQELATIAEEALPITIVLLDNGGYAEIEAQERARGIPPIGVRFANPDFVALARAFGIEASECTTPVEAHEAVSVAVAARTPRLVLIRPRTGQAPHDPAATNEGTP